MTPRAGGAAGGGDQRPGEAACGYHRAVAPTVPVALTGLAGVGLAWSLVLASVIAALQSADPRMLGRVMSLFALVLLGSTSAGGPIASAAASSIEPRAPFVIGAGAALATIVIASTSRRARLGPHRGTERVPAR